MNIALVLAGGTGTRLGAPIPKQFVEVNGNPVIAYTLSALQNHPAIERIQVVAVSPWEKKVTEYARLYGISKFSGTVESGQTRYLSTRRGMESLGDVADDDIIIVHDSVRPLVTAESLTDVIAVCRKYGNSMSVTDCTDTMYERTTQNATAREAERDKLVSGQTPEAVSGRRMREMYAAADKKNICLDSVSALQLRLGWQVHFAHGSKRNIKITRAEDIELFRALMGTKGVSYDL